MLSARLNLGISGAAFVPVTCGNWGVPGEKEGKLALLIILALGLGAAVCGLALGFAVGFGGCGTIIFGCGGCSGSGCSPGGVYPGGVSPEEGCPDTVSFTALTNANSL
jgi:hypothetical protein